MEIINTPLKPITYMRRQKKNSEELGMVVPDLNEPLCELNNGKQSPLDNTQTPQGSNFYSKFCLSIFFPCLVIFLYVSCLKEYSPSTFCNHPRTSWQGMFVKETVAENNMPAGGIAKVECMIQFLKNEKVHHRTSSNGGNHFTRKDHSLLL
ncbi:hypothetical protein CsatB_002510 [Cannabis sativa]